MKAIVIGLGSMGKRRVRLLKNVSGIKTIIGIDINEERREKAEVELGIKTAASLKEACEEYNPEMAFVSTSPLSHARIINDCLRYNLHVFTELNLVNDMYDENVKLAKDKDLCLFLSSTFMYRNEIQYIKKAIEGCSCSFSYMYHVGQYLPDWHPWENYKDYFVGDKRTNGCRELMAIELPWIIDTFGKIKRVIPFSRKISSLSIDFFDTYQLMIEHENGNSGLVLIDVVSRKAVRRLEINGEELYITWEGTPKSLEVYNKFTRENEFVTVYDEVERFPDYEDFIIENAYESEIEDFLHLIKGNKEASRYSFDKDRLVLEIIDSIERGNTYDVK